MRVPGFTAEVSLYKANTYYCGITTYSQGGQVVPVRVNDPCLDGCMYAFESCMAPCFEEGPPNYGVQCAQACSSAYDACSAGCIRIIDEQIQQTRCLFRYLACLMPTTLGGLPGVLIGGTACLAVYFDCMSSV